MYTSVKTRKKRRQVGPTCLKIPGENTGISADSVQYAHNVYKYSVCTSPTALTHPCGKHIHMLYYVCDNVTEAL